MPMHMPMHMPMPMPMHMPMPMPTHTCMYVHAYAYAYAVPDRCHPLVTRLYKVISVGGNFWMGNPPQMSSS